MALTQRGINIPVTGQFQDGDDIVNALIAQGLSVDSALGSVVGEAVAAAEALVNPVYYTATSSGSFVANYANGNVQQLIATGNTTIGLTGGEDGTVLTLLVRQGGLGGHALTWAAYINWQATPTPSTEMGAVDVFNFLKVGDKWLGFVAGLGFTVNDIADPFTAGNGTSLSGRLTPAGNAAWITPLSGTSNYSRAGTLEAVINNNRVESTTVSNGMSAAVEVPHANVRVSADYDLTAGSDVNRQARIFCRATSNTSSMILYLNSAGTVACEPGGGGSTVVSLGGGAPQSGTMSIVAIGSDFYFYINGALRGTQNYPTLTGDKAGFSTFGDTSRIDNFRVEYL